MVMTSSRDFDSDMKISSSRDFDPVHRCPGASLRLNAYPHFCGDVNQRGPALLIRQRQRRPPLATRRLGTSEKPYISPDPAARHGVRGATRAAIPTATSQHCRRRRGACKHALEDTLLDVQRTLSAPPAAPSPPHPVAACSPLRETVRRSCMTAR